MKPTEAQIQQSIINFLKYKGYYVQRMNSGAIRTVKGGLVRLAAKGTPDIMAFKRKPQFYVEKAFGYPSGDIYLLFIEVKRPGNKPTPAQAMMMKELEQYGARCIVATSIADIERQV